MILLWGLRNDSPLALVAERLEERGAPYLFLSHADVLDCHVEVDYDATAGTAVGGELEVLGKSYSLAEFSAFYPRPYDCTEFPHFADFEPDGPELRHAALFEDILWGFAERTPARVLNRPSTMLSNGSKPYQALLIRDSGFDVPETRITTDPEAARRFEADFSDVVYKSISGQRSIVGSTAGLVEERWSDLRWCPTQFQRRIPGVDYRVHVVGRRAFATRIMTGSVDYRYGSADYRAVELPPELEARCIRLAGDLGLELAGIDLRRTPKGRWYCFEVNPSPAYSCYESATGQPISEAIADLLTQRGCGDLAL